MQQLSKEQLIELVLRLQRPDKTSRTSSKPPSTDMKETRKNARPGGAKPGHEPHNRKLAEEPDAFAEHVPDVCERCGGGFGADAARELIGEYDEIDIQPLRPHVLRHQRFACRCEACGSTTKAPAPAAATTTPFGPRIHALAIYCKTFQALSYERLRFMFRDAFGLSVSEGALMNMFIRAHDSFKTEADKAKTILRAARVVASDETGVRIEGTNSYHWVFHCKDAVVHQPDYSRAARVVAETMGGHRPEVWISDRYSAQQKHGERHQTCLAHLARDTAFALQHGLDDLPLPIRLTPIPTRSSVWHGCPGPRRSDVSAVATGISALFPMARPVLHISKRPAGMVGSSVRDAALLANRSVSRRARVFCAAAPVAKT